jgi:hypothetical protein
MRQPATSAAMRAIALHPIAKARSEAASGID